MFSNFLASYKKISRSENCNNKTGFGLIELMVSITIVTIVLGIILTRQSGFNSAVLLRSQAYEIALSAREIQLGAISVSNINDDFRSPLGIYFDLDNDGAYKIFRDANSNDRYDPVEEFGVQGLLDKRFRISAIRDGGIPPPISISIMFQRPNFDARFFNTGGGGVDVPVVEVDVKLRSSAATENDCGKDVRTIEFTRTGQISVKEC